MWHSIMNQNDLYVFLETVNYFHDGCIKDIHYISGAFYQGDNMHPINSQRELTIIVQIPKSDIEMKFSKLKHMSLFPIDADYTCEIHKAQMFIKNGCVYWCDSADVFDDDKSANYTTVICAESLRWQKITRG